MLCKTPLISLLACVALPQVLIASCAAQTPAKGPATPTHVTAVSAGNSVEVTWTEDDTRAVSFTIKRAAKRGGPYAPLATISVDPISGPRVREFDDDGTYANDGDFRSGNTYYYVVIANDFSGTSPASLVAKSGPILPPPQAPFGIKLQNGDQSVNMCWDQSSDISGYNLYRSAAGSPYKLVAHIKDTSPTYTDNGLVNGTQYSYYITGVSDAGESVPSPSATAQPAPSLTTAAQAIQAARDFCKAIGEPVTGLPAAAFPVPLQGTMDPPRYWRPCWLIHFPRQVGIEVADDSKDIVSYFKDNDFGTVGKLDPSVSKAKLKATYEKVIAASGLDARELGAPAYYENRSDGTSANSWHLWDVSAIRQYKGIPYDAQAVSVSIQAVTGEVNSWDVGYAYPSPVNDVQTVTLSQAESLAKQFMIDHEIQGAFTGCKLSVVQPNSKLREGDGGDQTQSGPAVVAWDCGFNYTQGWNTHLWFSASDSSYLGGTQVGHDPSLNRR